MTYQVSRFAGRWPWAVEGALKKYGDVVRITPNELVFITPQVLSALYGSYNKSQEIFPKTQINNHGNGEHGGLVWEWDPVRHRQVARQLSPALKGVALKAKKPTLHRYINLFVERMKTLGGRVEVVSLPTWVSWLCVDISADMAYNREMDALGDTCLKESLRVMPGVLTGMSVVCPGALVDGTFIPKGVICQPSAFALARNLRNFHKPLDFRPERWLPP
ncbi:hypothetical protein GL218_01478 [Daldinia childiae]|uniref:uncharacterized protein n=1 Tax=Daldinia childiae TaxID=326645 RepID=UPI0014458AAC|nr:uncharacterized protein GL218_01478 [Daldinia childiae]KAF3064718.1 hypothetical protein GL218_01478 [Daldinia childiae]